MHGEFIENQWVRLCCGLHVMLANLISNNNIFEHITDVLNLKCKFLL